MWYVGNNGYLPPVSHTPKVGQGRGRAGQGHGKTAQIRKRIVRRATLEFKDGTYGILYLSRQGGVVKAEVT